MYEDTYSQWLASAKTLADEYADLNGIHLVNVALGTSQESLRSRTAEQRSILLRHLSTMPGETAILEQCYKAIDGLREIIKLSNIPLTSAQQQTLAECGAAQEAITQHWANK